MENPTGPRRSSPPKRFRFTAALPVLLVCACTLPESREALRSVPPSPEQQWSAPPAARPAEPPPPAAKEIPGKFRTPGATLSLGEAVDLSLRSSPRTRAAWLRMRAAAEGIAEEEGDRLPTVEAEAFAARQRGTSSGGNGTPTTLSGPSLSLSWLLFDLGGRRAEIDEAKSAFFAAGFRHDQAILDVALATEDVYLRYVAARALTEAAERGISAASRSLEAAEARHEAGLATLADVLSAKTALSQARLAATSARGDVLAIRGALAAALGVPATFPVEAEPLPAELRLDEAERDVDALLAEAGRNRPDLSAARAEAAEARAHAHAVRSEELPTLDLSAGAARTWQRPADGRTTSADPWSASLTLRVPIFSGGTLAAKTARAREEAAAAEADVAALERVVAVDVWTAAADLRTAAERIRASGDLLASATELEEVAAGRYREGVGTILDLVSAQASLEAARAADVRARAGWLFALARLAHATGSPGTSSGSTSLPKENR